MPRARPRASASLAAARRARAGAARAGAASRSSAAEPPRGRRRRSSALGASTGRLARRLMRRRAVAWVREVARAAQAQCAARGRRCARAIRSAQERVAREQRARGCACVISRRRSASVASKMRLAVARGEIDVHDQPLRGLGQPPVVDRAPCPSAARRAGAFQARRSSRSRCRGRAAHRRPSRRRGARPRACW